MQIGWRSRRALYQIHLWAGLVLAIPLLLSALTGGVLLFKFDVMRWLVPTAAQSVQLTTDRIGELGEELEQRFGVKLRSARLPDDRIGVVEVYLANDDAAYFDPVTHTVVREWSRHRDVFDVLFDLHHELLAGKVGRTLLGIVALSTAILLLIGVTLWLFPRRRFQISVRPRGRLELLASHRDLGVLICAPLLLTLMSAAVLAFPEGSRKFLDAALPGASDISKPPNALAGDVDWATAVAATHARYPTATIRMLVWPSKPNAPATLRVQQPEEWHPNGRTTVYIDPATSKIIHVRDALTEATGTKVANLAYPLHAATIGRAWWRWILFATALCTLLVGCYGVIAWWKKPS